MAIRVNLCQLCGGDAGALTDEVSRHEYAITGALCEPCRREALAPESDDRRLVRE